MATPNSTCSASPCGRPVHGRGMCAKHYQRWMNGTPKEQRPPITLEERFWAKVEKTSGCWNWTGSKTGSGYGHINVGGSMKRAHRVSYEMHVGPIPAGIQVDHACHNKLCVRPDHLRLATHKQNQEYLAGPKSHNKHSGLRGVYKNYGRGKPWRAGLTHNGRTITLGFFDSPQDAAEAAAQGRARHFTFPDYNSPKDAQS